MYFNLDESALKDIPGFDVRFLRYASQAEQRKGIPKYTSIYGCPHCQAEIAHVDSSATPMCQACVGTESGSCAHVWIGSGCPGGQLFCSKCNVDQPIKKA